MEISEEDGAKVARFFQPLLLPQCAASGGPGGEGDRNYGAANPAGVEDGAQGGGQQVLLGDQGGGQEGQDSAWRRAPP